MKNLKEYIEELKNNYDIKVTVINNDPVTTCTFEKYCEDNYITDPTYENHIDFINENWNVDRNRFYELYKKHTYEQIFETLSKSYDHMKLIDKITKQFHNKINSINIINSASDIKSFIIHYNKPFEEDEYLKSLLFFFNYHLVSSKKNEYLILPNKPTDKTSYIYDKCKGIVYHVTTKSAYDKILKWGLKPKTSISHNERIYIFAEEDIKKLKLDIISMTDLLQMSAEINNKYDKNYDVILKIDLNKYKNMLTFYDDENVEVFSAYWTSEYIPPFCIERININEI